MITAERKPIEEIVAMISPYRKVLVAGCGSCVAECAAGGEKETALLASALRMEARMTGRDLETREVTLERQCVYEFIDQLTALADQYEAVLSLACGAGVQAVAEVFPGLPILPALNTTFLGQTKEAGLWLENCRGCGDCRLHLFGDICPITRCAKSLFNGPCGGSQEGRCEVDPETPCAWQLIIESLDRTGRLEQLEAVYPPADWSSQQGQGPRKINREDQRN
ncbi:MAG: methylenetetrahydrofolate reductase C-terminal domain-containing protein [Desulfobacterota bacterium]|nr:methylenetetrahydrofolate reductase C-terminal domain-containing protein [Thermodesulfobacteriota bacterium]